MASANFYIEHCKTPTGVLHLVSDDAQRLRALDWEDCQERMQRLLHRHYGSAVQLREQHTKSPARRAVEAYFDGDLRSLAAIETATGGTEFQRDVWAALRTIPVGTTTSYGALAGQLGRAAAVRAVGAANGANPIAIVVPCHRVVGADASLTGYAGGLARKRWLLAHEEAWHSG